MIVRQIPVGTMANFVYLLIDETSKDGMLIDSGWETAPIVSEVTRVGAKVKFAVATHEHFDHVSTLHDAASKLGAKVVAHESSPLECDVRVKDGEDLELGGHRVRVLHTPGHTEDSICLYDGPHVFTGDTLFVGNIGKFDRERAEAMHHSLYEVLLKLPASTVMYPGHDYGDVPHRTLGEEAKSNPFLMAKDLRSFLSIFS